MLKLNSCAFFNVLISVLSNSIAIYRESWEYTSHHLLLPRTRFISKRNFLKATCNSFPRIS